VHLGGSETRKIVIKGTVTAGSQERVLLAVEKPEIHAGAGEGQQGAIVCRLFRAGQAAVGPAAAAGPDSGAAEGHQQIHQVGAGHPGDRLIEISANGALAGPALHLKINGVHAAVRPEGEIEANMICAAYIT
jgi:hypothetical protein